MTPKGVYASIAALLIIVAACSGSLRGVMRSDATRVSLNYSDSQSGSAHLYVVLPEGERFEGQAARGTDRTQPKAGATAGMDRFEAVETFQGNADAILSGDRGNIMQCRFHLTDVILGFRGGGFGVCQLADGRVLDIFF